MKKVLILIVLALIVTVISSTNEYVEIPSTSIRMRVIAASDKEQDQENKMIIKSILEEKLYEIIENSSNVDEVETSIIENKQNIDEAISNTIKENGMNIDFTSNFGLNYFPEKEFKGLTYVAGNYKSFVVTLGQGKGENWWCVLYPPLCMIDETADEYEYHSLIKDTLEKYN